MILSVIVPCYNIADYIDRCLASLRDQDLAANEYEIIVVDDGSTDDSLRHARQHEAGDPRVSVLSQPNHGVSAARNAGLDKVTGEYVYFVDGDDFVNSDALRPVVEGMRERSLDIACVGWHRVRSGEDVPAPRSESGVARFSAVTNGIDYFADHLQYPTGVWAFVIDRSFLNSNGVRFEVGRLFEDQLFPAEALAVAQRVASVDQDVYRYLLRPGSITQSTDPGHSRRLFGDLEHVVFGLEVIRQRTTAARTATPAFLDRLTVMQHGYAFLLIAKIIRSRLPLRPLLPGTITRLRTSGFYPLMEFRDRDHRGLRYRVLTTVFNHRTLLYPFAYAYRAGAAVQRWASRDGGVHRV